MKNVTNYCVMKVKNKKLHTFAQNGRNPIKMLPCPLKSGIIQEMDKTKINALKVKIIAHYGMKHLLKGSTKCHSVLEACKHPTPPTLHPMYVHMKIQNRIQMHHNKFFGRQCK